MERPPRRPVATTRQKVAQALLGLLVFAVITLIAFTLLVLLVKEQHLGATTLR